VRLTMPASNGEDAIQPVANNQPADR